MRKSKAIKTMRLSFCTASILLAGCAGTMYTRSNPQGTFFGKPVYAAVTEDFCVTFACGGRDDLGIGWLGDYNMLKPESFPLDFVFDTVFLPADLVAWSMGYSKHAPKPHNEKKEVEEAKE